MKTSPLLNFLIRYSPLASGLLLFLPFEWVRFIVGAFMCAYVVFLNHWVEKNRKHDTTKMARKFAQPGQRIKAITHGKDVTSIEFYEGLQSNSNDEVFKVVSRRKDRNARKS